MSQVDLGLTRLLSQTAQQTSSEATPGGPSAPRIWAEASGMVGYLPHREAFSRGSYETTFSDVSKLAPPAGEILTEVATRPLRDLGAILMSSVRDLQPLRSPARA